ncbi:putative membrane protein [Synechococcus sp. ROS8604]|jgi:hypothetical protein|nr:putative membrane protein [Synechococcus sp. ROS8604]
MAVDSFDGVLFLLQNLLAVGLVWGWLGISGSLPLFLKGFNMV